ncbi:uncharacterized protein EDB91DRAFT_1240573 [Suillus paluster]|uniref:uncharacterized protein n=1 Tax=Suillus paluster TaxID=48578 RepID=UPI001B864FA8|nr:uncharacterized protein EDB91DRAFT_1240573 [Suillus paluster]KAG1719498.1 hypothetical protein EDB91DRAFT_1240573 [Suillus paluster]
MIMKNGPRRASFMWGSSTRNTRIERLWVEVGTQFARRWRAFFTRLENYHRLDPQAANHIWLLQSLFLDEINSDCLNFQAEWNCHPIRGPDTNNKSPKDLRFLGHLQFGIYRDDCEGVHPDVINEYYGVHGHTTTRQRHQTGAGHPADEEDSDSDSDGEHPSTMVQAINNQQRHQIRHEAISVPSQQNPFVDDATRQQFSATLDEVIANDITPNNCRLTLDEWDGDEYPTFETITFGQRGSKELHVSLAEPIWFNRAKLWCQALLVLSYFLTASSD